MTLEQSGLLRISVGRVGLQGDVLLFVPEDGTWDGDVISLSGSAGGWGTPGSEYAEFTPADGLHLREQLRGLNERRDGTTLDFVCPSDPIMGGLVELDSSCKVANVDLFAGEFTWSMVLTRVAAGSRRESFLMHDLRAGSDVSAANSRGLVGVPPAATTYQRGADGFGDLVGRAVDPDAGGGSVLVDTWPGDTARAPAYWTCPSGGALDGAVRLRRGPALQAPGVDATAEAVLLLHASGISDVEDPWPNFGTAGAVLDADPTVVRGALVGPDDPEVFGAHTSTNASTSFTTPWSADHAITGDLSMFARLRGVGDVLAAGTEFHLEAMAKLQTLVVGPGWDEADYSLTIGLVSPFVPNKIAAGWFDSSDVQHSVNGGPDLNAFEWNEVGFTLDVNNGAGGHTVRFYVDGVLVDTVITAGTTDVRDNGGPLTAGSFSEVIEWAEVWDGLFDAGGTLAASFRAEDTNVASTHLPPGPADTFVSSATGETWTLGSDCAVFEQPTAVHALVGGSSRWSTPDDAAIDIGTGDWTILLDVTAPSADINGQAWQFASKRSGTLGAGGTGWQAMSIRNDAGSLLGEGFIVSDGTDPLARISSAGGGSQIIAAVLDRSANIGLYVDGDEKSSTSMTAVGDMSTSTALLFGTVGAPPFLLRSHVQWDRALSEEEVNGSGTVLAGGTPGGTLAEQFAAYRTIVGRHAPGDLDGWVLENGLERVYPTIGLPWRLTFECWDDGWQSATTIEPATSGGVVTSQGLTILRNAQNGEAVAIQLLGRDATGAEMPTLDLAMRRGDRMVAALLKNLTSTVLSATAAEGSAAWSLLTGGAVLTANDPDGNRPLLTTGVGVADDDASSADVSVTGTSLDFGFGHEIGGTGSAGIETAQSLANQYAAWVDETVAIRGAP